VFRAVGGEIPRRLADLPVIDPPPRPDVVAHPEQRVLLSRHAGTGCRISEARGQRWADVDLTAREVLIRGTKTESQFDA